MDILLSRALEEIALDGIRGCSIESLWRHLRDSAEGESQKTFTQQPEVQRELWKHILEYVGEGSLKVYATVSPTCEHSYPSHSYPTDEDKEMQCGCVLLSAKHPGIQNLCLAEKLGGEHGIHIVASAELRNASLGLCAFQSGAKLSVVQHKALEMVGRSRTQGFLQADLARALKIEHRSFHYVVNRLTATHLVKSTPVMVHKDSWSLLPSELPRNRCVTKHTMTNLLHLARYCPADFARSIVYDPSVDLKGVTEDTSSTLELPYMARDRTLLKNAVCERLAAVRSPARSPAGTVVLMGVQASD
ncbi:hypothetical protein CYMTET_43194 [Cymbomonas tetramitiformis]|uniref:B-block binding subunit of TFIIIC domain-containing protein n=1 Tax=Cymbomonas tetramitiformis TaxID=36881 RepID=A0AAE0C2R9_9CHLO|nr:hypothetical protein CYMTET_43194 [Cymbomonas tetramitiformis]